MTITTQAVILARGRGSRMRAEAGSATLSAEQASAAASGAKAMMPFARPFLDYVLSALADGGITEAALVVEPGASELRRHMEASAAGRRVAIRFAEQVEPLGTANAVLSARNTVRDAPFLMLNADNLYPADVCADLAAIGAPGIVAFEAESLVRESGFEAARVMRFALLDFDDDGCLRAIREKPAPDDPLVGRQPHWVSMNLWSFTPAIFDFCAAVTPSLRGELELADAVTNAIASGMRVQVLRRRAGVLDLTSRDDVSFVGDRLAAILPRP